MIDLRREGDVFLLRMEQGENRFRPESVRAWNEALDEVKDEVEKAGSPCALVTTGSGRFYSNGLDLEWWLGEGRGEPGYIPSVLAVLARVLTLPCISVCALNGHAFGAGALLALCHDHRVMRRDRGWFCMPEVDMGAPLHPGMTAILKARLPGATAHRVITEGHRWTGPEALAAGIVDAVADEEELLPAALARAAERAGKATPALATLKRDLYPEVLEALALPATSVSTA